MKASVLGLGQMGSAITAALVSAGRDITVWNRTPGKAVENAAAAPTAASPVVLAMVSDNPTVREIYGGALINLVTGSPEDAQAMGEWPAARGIDYLDGAMLAVPQSLATPDAQFLYSGSTAVFDEYRELLDALATSRHLGPDPTVAAVWDSALLGIAYSALLGYLHAAALLDTVGTAPAQFHPMVGQWLSTMAGLMTELGGEIESRQHRDATSPVGVEQVGGGQARQHQSVPWRVHGTAGAAAGAIGPSSRRRARRRQPGEPVRVAAKPCGFVVGQPRWAML